MTAKNNREMQSRFTEESYQVYCYLSSGEEKVTMDSARFFKFCSDCGIIDTSFKKISVDLLFTKATRTTKKRLNYINFIACLKEIAKRKGHVKFDEFVNEISATSSGPKFFATVPEYSKFHDDTSTFTGTHVNGGPTIIDPAELAKIVDRSRPADNRGVMLYNIGLTECRRTGMESPAQSLTASRPPAQNVFTFGATRPAYRDKMTREESLNDQVDPDPINSSS